MTTFTPLHRALGVAPGPITPEMLDTAVAQHLRESRDLDWKRQPAQGVGWKDEVAKDIAAMANSGGGLIVYGIHEDGDAGAACRFAVLEFPTEQQVRQLAWSAVQPPVAGVVVHEIAAHMPAFAIEVPASLTSPHFVTREVAKGNFYLGAPTRNGSHTFWLDERQIESAYRARLEERQQSQESLRLMFEDLAMGYPDDCARFIAVARPVIPTTNGRLDKRDAEALREEAWTEMGRHLDEHVAPHDRFPTVGFASHWDLNPFNVPWGSNYNGAQRGLRRWFLSRELGAKRLKSDYTPFPGNRAPTIEAHDNGSVSLAVAVGGEGVRVDTGDTGQLGAMQMSAGTIEMLTLAFASLIRVAGRQRGTGEYQLMVAIEWAVEKNTKQLTVLPLDVRTGFPRPEVEAATQLRVYPPILSSLDALAPDDAFHAGLYTLVMDCLNQAGVHTPVIVGTQYRPDRGAA
ncbi:ATP-binding protein [Rathayibacter sp. YIM 133350]|uniref:AlbA family DNA-binding domain-containing protein n=1 Tax=Rathayibacter sp. YIM 133350 TaxID=3131992 RepID=UPI00307F6B97